MDAAIYQGDVFRRAAGECWRPGGLGLTRRGLALCAFPEQALVVDVGCGPGASVRLLRELGCLGFGLDLAVHVKGLPMARARAEAPPFAPGSLDGIVCECTLSLLEDAERILKIFGETCRTGSRMLLTDIYSKDGEREHLFSRQSLEAALCGAGWKITHFEDHSKAVKELAAQLLWRSEANADSLFSSSTPGSAFFWRGLGYGLWVAEKA